MTVVLYDAETLKRIGETWAGIKFIPRVGEVVISNDSLFDVESVMFDLKYQTVRIYLRPSDSKLVTPSK